MSQAGSYQAVTPEGAAAEAERLKGQVAALWSKESAALRAVGLPDGARVLEVGCGSGAVLAQVGRAFSPRFALGVERDVQNAGLARQVGPVVRADGAALPLAAQSFDAVLFRFVLRHAPSPERLVSEAVRVLRPGGRLLAVDGDDGALMLAPAPPGWPTLSAALAASVRRRGADPEMGRNLRALLHRAGLRDVRALGLAVTNDDVPGPLFVQLFLAPEGRPVDADLLEPAAARQAWAELRAWAASPSSFLCALGIFAGGTKP